MAHPLVPPLSLMSSAFIYLGFNLYFLLFFFTYRILFFAIIVDYVEIFLYFQVLGFNNQSLFQQNIYPYFALPENYLGNQLKSYGGFIKYRIRYEGGSAQIFSPDIIISVGSPTCLRI